MVSAVRQAAPPTKVIELCKNYSVSITLLCLFYHTGTLALSMTWKDGSDENNDYRSPKHPSETQHFRFLCAEDLPQTPP